MEKGHGICRDVQVLCLFVLQIAARFNIISGKGGDHMAVKSANVNVRVEPEIKEQAEKILDRVGVSASTLINMTYRQVILQNGIPFQVRIPREIRTRDVISDEEFDRMLAAGLQQAETGDSVPCETAFGELLKGL